MYMATVLNDYNLSIQNMWRNKYSEEDGMKYDGKAQCHAMFNIKRTHTGQ